MNRLDASLTRRDFIRRSAVAATVAAAGVRATAVPSVGQRRYPIVAFSKEFQDLNPRDTAELVAEIGLDGIECPVRPRGHIEPERAADELPAMAAALRRRGADVHIVTTAITSMDDPHAETVLRTASALGIKVIRLGYWRYTDDDLPVDRLKEIKPAIRDIEAACRELGLTAGYQNHSGRNYVGAPIWDIMTLIRELNSPHFQMCFDIGHATVIGGMSWPIQARLAESHLAAVYVKDFFWNKDHRGWRPAWCNLGEGMIDRAFFDQVKASAFRGPITQHHEYELGDRRQKIAHMRRDLRVLRSWLA